MANVWATSKGEGFDQVEQQQLGSSKKELEIISTLFMGRLGLNIT